MDKDTFYGLRTFWNLVFLNTGERYSESGLKLVEEGWPDVNSATDPFKG